MTTFDLSPLFRVGVGFDRLACLAQSALHRDGDQEMGYPPYNIEKSGDSDYRITLAVAGFAEDELTVEVQNGFLTVSGARSAKDDDRKPVFLHHGIAERNFTRRFQLADHIEVVGAKLSEGLLMIMVTREVPEEAKLRRIDIAAASALPKAA